MVVDIHREDGRGNVLRTVYPCHVTWAGKSFTIPRGFESDGASVPRFFWRLICPPLDHRAVRAGVAHDFIYRTQPPGWTRKEADKMFLAFLIEDGLPPSQARLAYWGVRLGGWVAWNDNASWNAVMREVEEAGRPAAYEAAKAHDDAYRQEGGVK